MYAVADLGVACSVDCRADCDVDSADDYCC